MNKTCKKKAALNKDVLIGSSRDVDHRVTPGIFSIRAYSVSVAVCRQGRGGWRYPWPQG